MMKKILFVGFVFAVSAALADTWTDNPWIYRPVSSGRTLSDETYWSIYDSRGNTAKLKYVDGVLDVDSLDKAISSLKLSVNSVFSTMASLGGDIIAIDADLVTMDKSLADLSGKLDSTFADVMKRLSKLELQDQASGISKSLSRRWSDDKGTVYVGDGIFNVAGAQVDGVTIVSNINDRIQLSGFSSSVQSFSIPFYSDDFKKLIWTRVGGFADGDSIQDKMEIGSETYSSNLKLAGWEEPTTAPHLCVDTIAGIITNASANASHYILTKKTGGQDDGKLHYMRVGTLTDLGGGGASALKLYGTDGTATVVGTGSATNVVRFASAADSSVSVTVAKTNGTEAVVTIGVYWKN